MEYNLGILISGNGSNMLNIIEATKKKLIKSKVATVVSNNPLALGIKRASEKGIDVKIIDLRRRLGSELIKETEILGIKIYWNSTITNTFG